METLGSATVDLHGQDGHPHAERDDGCRLWVDGQTLAITGEGWQPRGEVQVDGRRAELRDDGAPLLLLQAGMLASDARLELRRRTCSAGHWRLVGDPTESALVVAAAKAGLHRETVEALLPARGRDPLRLRAQAHEHRSTASPVARRHRRSRAAGPRGLAPYVMFAKGAPDLLLERCSQVRIAGHDIGAHRRRGATRSLARPSAALASRALRVLGVACRPLQTPARRTWRRRTWRRISRSSA